MTLNPIFERRERTIYIDMMGKETLEEVKLENGIEYEGDLGWGYEDRYVKGREYNTLGIKSKYDINLIERM